MVIKMCAENTLKSNDIDITTLANAIRALAMDAVEQANSGHPGMPMGMADVATVLFSKHLRFDAQNSNWADRDRFVLSAGHGSMLLYALLYLTGYPGVTLDQLRQFRQLGSPCAGHPEYGHLPGIETTTGPLGQGIANAVGMALAERCLNARYGDDLVSHDTYVIAGDGCLMEGISHEAASLAGHLGLGRLIVLFDDNGITIDGPTSLSTSEDVGARFAAYGWDIDRIDGHDGEAIDQAIMRAKNTAQPSLICCKTHIGYGAPTKQDSAKAHGAPLGEDEIIGARKSLGWRHDAFVIPEAILAAWRTVGRRCSNDYANWQIRLEACSNDTRFEFENAMKGRLPQGWDSSLKKHTQAMAKDQPKIASRVASQKALDALVPVIPGLIGGSADLTGSNNTKALEQRAINKQDFSGSYVYYGIREHAMASAMNGMQLHGGVRAYGGTFLVFSDYARPAIRLASLMNLPVIYVMTHDSIGLGEDGPTHQPVEHLASLRAIPNLDVLRPADAVETAECWHAALERTDGPSLLALSRQGLQGFRSSSDENMSSKGGYVVSDGVSNRDITLIASGSEVGIAIDAAHQLSQEGIKACVVSMPSLKRFFEQSTSWQDTVLGASDKPRIVIEAGICQGWEGLIGRLGAFIGMTGFGASAPANLLYKHFGINAQAVVDKTHKLLQVGQ